MMSVQQNRKPNEPTSLASHLNMPEGVAIPQIMMQPMAVPTCDIPMKPYLIANPSFPTGGSMHHFPMAMPSNMRMPTSLTTAEWNNQVMLWPTRAQNPYRPVTFAPAGNLPLSKRIVTEPVNVTATRFDVSDPNGKILTKRPQQILEDRATPKSSKLMSVYDTVWYSMFERLVGYKRDNGDCLVPKRYKDQKLGRWVENQRNTKSSLSSDRVQKLESIGFVWNVQDGLWDNMFDRLMVYKGQHGDCSVPQRYRHDAKLGGWVHMQRSRRRKHLTKDRMERLDSIGFVWNVHQRKDTKSAREQI